MKICLLLKKSVVSWFFVILRFPSVLQQLSRNIRKKECLSLNTVVAKLLEDRGKRQSNNKKWKVVLLIMIGISFTFILTSCGAKGPLYLPENIQKNNK